jgi:hypothetical protein
MPIGIHSVDAFYYTPEGKQFQGDGVTTVMNRNMDESWDEYVGEKSFKTPDYNGKWMQFSSNAASLPDALQEARQAVSQ